MNKAIIIGRLGRDPETRQAGTSTVCNFSVATSEKFKDKAGEMQERTEWHDVAVWGKSAENAARMLARGSLVSVEGRITTRKWEKDGQERRKTEIVADDWRLLGGGKPKDGQQQRPAPDAYDGPPDDLPF